MDLLTNDQLKQIEKRLAAIRGKPHDSIVELLFKDCENLLGDNDELRHRIGAAKMWLEGTARHYPDGQLARFTVEGEPR